MLSWSDNVDQKILEGISKYGNNWKLISKNIPNKTPQQIRDRYRSVLKPKDKAFIKSKDLMDEGDIEELQKAHGLNIKKVQVFTKEEDEKIIKLAGELKKDWIKIAS